MKVNIFREGRWLTLLAILLWLGGSLRDAINLQLWSGDWSLVLGAFICRARHCRNLRCLMGDRLGLKEGPSNSAGVRFQTRRPSTSALTLAIVPGRIPVSPATSPERTRIRILKLKKAEDNDG